MTESSNAASPARPRRRWLRFSLRTLFVMMTIVIVPLGWYVNRCERQRRTVAAIQRLDSGAVSYVLPKASSWEETWQVWLLERGVPQDYLRPVQNVGLMGAGLDDEWLRKLEPLPTTKHMLVVSEGINDALPNLSRWHGLESLKLVCVPLTDERLGQMQPLQQLRHLSLAGSTITGSGLAELSLPELESLDVVLTQFSDDQIEVLKRQFPKLKSIRIDGTRVTEAGRKRLNDLGIEFDHTLSLPPVPTENY